jgi:PAS domain S-box-containing protein
MRHNLNTKIIITFIVIMFISNSITGGLSTYYYMSQYTEALQGKVMVIGQGLKLQLDRLFALEIPLEDLMGFEEQCQEVIEKYPDISYATVTNTDGEILFQSNSPPEGEYLEIPAIVDAIRDGKDQVIDYFYRQNRYYGFIIALFDISGKHLGAVVLGLPVKIITQRVFYGSVFSILLSLFIFVLSLFGIIYFLKRLITSPLQQLGQATQEIGSGGIESFQEVRINSRDEMEDLANSFNTMAADLKRTTVSKEYVDRIISSMMDALIVVDSQNEICTVNKAAETMFKYSSAEMLNQRIQILLTEETHQFFHSEEFKKAIREGGLNNLEVTMVSKSGEIIPTLLSCSVIKDGRGEVRYIVSTAKDITERKKAELALMRQAEKLARNNAQLQEFAYIASHDLQEPLRKIMAFGDRLKTKCAGVLDEQALDYLDRIQNATSRMQILINDLLLYSRITTEAQPFTIVDLGKVASEVLIDLETRIEQTQGKVEIEALPSLEAEPTQMRQLFQNMIGNALKFHRENVAPAVKVSCRTVIPNTQPHSAGLNRQFCELRFTDNGIGIEEKYFSRIFGVFQKLHGRDQYEGTGVGLAICQRIIERHHGEIRVESVFGEGTTFIIKLPIKQDFPEE